MNTQDYEKVKILSEYLINLGFDKNVAKTIAYLFYYPDRTARDIEFDMEMRQPEVSVALQYCMKRNWTKNKKEKKETKGRPLKIHKLNKSLNEILEEFISERQDGNIKYNEILEKIKEIS